MLYIRVEEYNIRDSGDDVISLTCKVTRDRTMTTHTGNKND